MLLRIKDKNKTTNLTVSRCSSEISFVAKSSSLIDARKLTHSPAAVVSRPGRVVRRSLRPLVNQCLAIDTFRICHHQQQQALSRLIIMKTPALVRLSPRLFADKISALLKLHPYQMTMSDEEYINPVAA